MQDSICLFRVFSAKIGYGFGGYDDKHLGVFRDLLAYDLVRFEVFFEQRELGEGAHVLKLHPPVGSQRGA
jgi:hypothetical protein